MSLLGEESSEGRWVLTWIPPKTSSHKTHRTKGFLGHPHRKNLLPHQDVGTLLRNIIEPGINIDEPGGVHEWPSVTCGDVEATTRGLVREGCRGL